MYDASLDVFRENNWSLDLYTSNGISQVYNTGAAFNTFSSYFYDKPGEYHSYVSHVYDELDWFGMNYWGGYYP